MSYFIKKSVNKKGVYLQIYEGHLDKERGCVVHTSYRALGYLDDLVGSGIPDPVAHFQKEVDELNAKLKLERYRKKTVPKLIGTRTPERNTGYFPVKMILDGLNVKGVIDLLQGVAGFRFDLYHLVSSLVFARIVSPCSKRATYLEVLPSLFSEEKASYDQILDCCCFLGREYGKFVELFNAMVQKKYGTDTSRTYFDCTNFYFEIDREDGFRKKGPSKENRTDPIVGLGLLLDADMIPIGMSMYPGNQSEKPVIREVVESLKARNQIRGRTVQVADKGLNCAENIVTALKSGDGYIFSKSIKQLPDVEKTWVLMEDGMTEVRGSDGSLRYKYKECIDEFPYTAADGNGRMVTIRLTEKRVLTYNPRLADKQQAEIRKQAAKAKGLCCSRAKRSEFGDCGKYVDFKSKNDEDAKILAVVNQDAIDRDLAMAGYNLLVTSEVKRTAQEVYSIYHNLWRIEESFRIMKTDLDARPVFLQKEDAIKGHFLICYISVLLVRLLQFKVLKNQFGTPEIMHFMKKFKVMKTEGSQYINLSQSSPFTDSLAGIYNLPLNHLYIPGSAMKLMKLD